MKLKRIASQIKKHAKELVTPGYVDVNVELGLFIDGSGKSNFSYDGLDPETRDLFDHVRDWEQETVVQDKFVLDFYVYGRRKGNPKSWGDELITNMIVTVEQGAITRVSEEYDKNVR